MSFEKIVVGTGDVLDMLTLAGFDATEAALQNCLVSMRVFLAGLSKNKLHFHVRVLVQ